MTSQAEYITRQLHQAGLSGRLAIDVDDTLSKTTENFIVKLNQMFPTERVITVAEAERHYGLTGECLHWGDLPEAKEYLSYLAHAPEEHRDLNTFPGAVEGMKKLYDEGLIGCYFTARIEDMRVVTEDWLHRHGLPDAPIFMRDESVGFDYHHGWKGQLLNDLLPNVSGTIDNAALVARHAEKLGYKGKFFLFGLTDADYQSTTGRVIPVQNWEIATPTVLRHLK